MKIPQIFKKIKFQAMTSTARPMVRENVDEPDMKLSSAFIVVLVLHVVAIGGIYAFNSIKSGQPVADEPVKPRTVAPSENSTTESKPAPHAALFTTAKSYRVKTGDTLAKMGAANGVSVEELETANGLKNAAGLRVGQEIKIPAKSGGKPLAGDARHVPETKTASPGVKDSGEIYTIVKGDNPVGIARKLHVNYDELLKLNKIDEPKKLQIGQKLRIPAKHKSDVALTQ